MGVCLNVMPSKRFSMQQIAQRLKELERHLDEQEAAAATAAATGATPAPGSAPLGSADALPSSFAELSVIREASKEGSVSTAAAAPAEVQQRFSPEDVRDLVHQLLQEHPSRTTALPIAKQLAAQAQEEQWSADHLTVLALVLVEKAVATSFAPRIYATMCTYIHKQLGLPFRQALFKCYQEKFKIRDLEFAVGVAPEANAGEQHAALLKTATQSLFLFFGQLYVLNDALFPTHLVDACVSDLIESVLDGNDLYVTVLKALLSTDGVGKKLLASESKSFQLAMSHLFDTMQANKASAQAAAAAAPSAGDGAAVGSALAFTSLSAESLVTLQDATDARIGLGFLRSLVPRRLGSPLPCPCRSP